MIVKVTLRTVCFFTLLLCLTSGISGQSLPTDMSLTVPDNLESTIRATLNNYLFDISSSKLKSSVSVEQAESANLRGMENKTVAIMHVLLVSNYQGKEVKSERIELKGAGTHQREAETKALRQLPRNALFKKWLADVNAMIPLKSDSACTAITLLEGVSLPTDGKEAAGLVRYVSSFRENMGCDKQANDVLEVLSAQYADRQCSALDALEIEIAAATYNRGMAVQQLKRIRPEGPCWARALSLAEKIGADTRASLSNTTKSAWVNWFVRERMLH